MNKKKYIIIGLIAAILVAIALFFILESRGGEGVSNDVTSKIEPSSSILDLVTTEKDSVIYFDRGDKAFYEVNADGKEKLVQLDYEPFNILYSPDRSKALAMALGRPITVVNLLEKTTKDINEKVFNPAFSPDSQSIAFHYLDAETSKSILYTSDPYTKGLQEIANFPYFDQEYYIVRWPEPDYIWHMLITSDITEVPIMRTNTATKKSQTVATGYFHDFKVSPDAKHFAVIAPAASGRDETDINSRDYENVFLQVGSNGEPLFNTKVRTNTALITWSPNSEIIYALGKTENGSALYKVKMDGTAEILTENPIENILAIIELVYINDHTFYATENNKVNRIELK